MTRRWLAAALAAALLTTAAPANALNPEDDKTRGPADDAGFFLGYPLPTYSWHGCTGTSTQRTPEPLDPGVPAVGKGTKQAKVTWTSELTTATTAGYVLRWEVTPGWKICGVQVATKGDHPDAPSYLAMEAGYTSKASKGSTVTTGSETIKVPVSKSDAQELGMEKVYGGKKYAIAAIYHVTVFVKKK